MNASVRASPEPPSPCPFPPQSRGREDLMCRYAAESLISGEALKRPGASARRGTGLAGFVLLLAAVGCGASNEDLFLSQVERVREGTAERIDIRETPINDTALLGRLQGLQDLRELNLDQSPVTDADLARIGPLPKLTSLSLTQTQITDQGLAKIAEQFPALEFLRLDETMIRDSGLKHLKSMEKLHALSLFRTHITDQGCAALAEIDSLRRISLDQTLVGDEGLRELAGLPNLRQVSVWQTQVSDEAVARVQKSSPNLDVSR